MKKKIGVMLFWVIGYAVTAQVTLSKVFTNVATKKQELQNIWTVVKPRWHEHISNGLMAVSKQSRLTM